MAAQRGGRVSTTARPSATTPSGPAGGLMNAVTLVVWAFCTNRAAWISSPNTTTHPRPRACGLAATATAASRLAGPSAPARVGFRMAPVNTTGASPSHSRSSRNAVSSMVSVPWLTTTPSAPWPICCRMAWASSSRSSTASDELGSWRKSCTSSSVPARSRPGMEASRSAPAS